MSEQNNNESAWRRGWRDTIRFAMGPAFLVLDIGGTAVIGVLTQDPWVTVIFFIAVFSALAIGCFGAAPLKQRNDARGRVKALENQVANLISPHKLNLRIDSMAYGGILENGPVGATFTAFLTLQNVGTSPTAAENWRIHLRAPGRGVMEGQIIKSNLPMNMKPDTGRDRTLSEKEWIVEKTDTAIQPGDQVSGYLASVFSEVAGGLNPEEYVGYSITVSARDISGTTYSDTHTIHGENDPELYHRSLGG